VAQLAVGVMAQAQQPADNRKQAVLRYVPRSTVKLEQLIGDENKKRYQPTLSRTVTRYHIQGTDLGYSFASGPP
jgi:hypothetical protein